MGPVEGTVSKWLPEPSHPATCSTPMGVGNVGDTHRLGDGSAHEWEWAGRSYTVPAQLIAGRCAPTGRGPSMLLDAAVGADVPWAPLKTVIILMCVSQLMIKILIICSDVEN